MSKSCKKLQNRRQGSSLLRINDYRKSECMRANFTTQCHYCHRHDSVFYCSFWFSYLDTSFLAAAAGRSNSNTLGHPLRCPDCLLGKMIIHDCFKATWWLCTPTLRNPFLSFSAFIGRIDDWEISLSEARLPDAHDVSVVMRMRV